MTTDGGHSGGIAESSPELRLARPDDDGTARAADGRERHVDTDLLRHAAAGDDAALRTLLAEHDTRVRYVIFRVAGGRCRRDPQWLDSVASRAWSGLIDWQRNAAGGAPESVGALVCRIARNQAISALRAEGRRGDGVSAGAGEDVAAIEAVDESVDPADAAERLDDLAALRGCLAGLSEEDRSLSEALDLIVNRRWREAGESLGMSESTLRSRWNRVLERLRACLTGKTGKTFAPRGGSGD